MNSEAQKEYSLISNTLEEINFYSFDKDVLERVSMEIWTELNERDLRLVAMESTLPEPEEQKWKRTWHRFWDRQQKIG